ncbi:probable G-protein coupled receptor 139 [Mobula birostris]|uniref:probable G-protein coupled receptor 139 n=1 Tax=Mobula birostris TaxID=1983395 RepID=UPI003B281C0A
MPELGEDKTWLQLRSSNWTGLDVRLLDRTAEPSTGRGNPNTGLGKDPRPQPAARLRTQGPSQQPGSGPKAPASSQAQDPRPQPAARPRTFHQLIVRICICAMFKPSIGSNALANVRSSMMFHPANLVAIVILSRGKCGLSKCITLYLVGMAAADLLVVISNPLLKWTAEIYFPRSFLLITAVCRLVTWLMFASTAASVWLTVAFTVDRFVAICCEKLKTKYCTERTAAVVIGTVSVLACLETVPWGFVVEPAEIINGVPWDCVMTPSFRNSPSWATFEIFHRIFYPCVPFILMLLFNILTVRRILVASRARRGLRGQKSGEKDKDREMENRRKSIVLLFSITGSFILLWATLVVFSNYRRVTKSYVYSATDPLYVTDHASTMLQILSSCTNTCIYALTQSKFREELKNAVKYPLNLMLKLMKR